MNHINNHYSHMPQFLVQAKDFTDNEALQRRLAVRETHLARMQQEKEKGIFIIGGALLDTEENMVGSLILLSLPDEDSVWKWIEQDVYKTGKVWNEISVSSFRVAPVLKVTATVRIVTQNQSLPVLETCILLNIAV